MVKIDILVEEGEVSRGSVLEKERYASFLELAFKDNLEHSLFVQERYLKK